MFDVGCSMLAVGCSMFGVGCSTLAVRALALKNDARLFLRDLNYPKGTKAMSPAVARHELPWVLNQPLHQP